MTDTILRALRTYGLTLPGTHLKSPWPGHKDLAVKDKTFAYLSLDGEPFSISVKLARSHEVAMLIPGAVPTAYGLGKSGWVTMTFAGGDVPEDLLREWIEESYRLQAPKKLVALLPASSSTPSKAPAKTPPATKPETKAAAATKAAKKKKTPATKKKAMAT